MLISTVKIAAPYFPYFIAVDAFRLFLKCLLKSTYTNA